MREIRFCSYVCSWMSVIQKSYTIQGNRLWCKKTVSKDREMHRNQKERGNSSVVTISKIKTCYINIGMDKLKLENR